MRNRISDIVERVRDWFAWAPNWLIGIAVLAAAGLFALLFYRAVRRLLARTLGARHPFVERLLARIGGPIRLALVIFALTAALPAAPFAPAVIHGFRHGLAAALVLLVGWAALAAIDLTADLYLGRMAAARPAEDFVARKHRTQVRVLGRAVKVLVVVLTCAAALMTFDAVRQYGVSLFASAGAAGLVVGLAARPVLANVIAGIQLALTQPIRLEDAVIVEGEWGWIEEITGTYVVIRIWDWRRLIVPLSYFIEKPFQNWTRDSTALIGSVMLYVDYTVPVERVRRKLTEIVEQSKLWDRQVVNLQVSDAKEGTIELRALVSAATSPATWDLRCEVREKLIAFLQSEYPGALPRRRAELSGDAAVVPLRAEAQRSDRAPRRVWSD